MNPVQYEQNGFRSEFQNYSGVNNFAKRKFVRMANDSRSFNSFEIAKVVKSKLCEVHSFNKFSLESLLSNVA